MDAGTDNRQRNDFRLKVEGPGKGCSIINDDDDDDDNDGNGERHGAIIGNMRLQWVAVNIGFTLFFLGCAILKIRFTLFNNNSNSMDKTITKLHSQNYALDDNKNQKNVKSIDSCVDAVNLLSLHIHEDQESHGLRPFTGSIELPGLDYNLFRKSFFGRRIFFVGDSTLSNLYTWLRNLLQIYLEFPHNSSHFLSDMNLRDANSLAASVRGCKYKRRSEALSCDDEQLNLTNRHDLGLSIIHDECSTNYTNKFSAMRDFQPEIIVANLGLWLLHFQASSRDQEACVAKQWTHYEDWLGYTLRMAEEVGARALFFKTTNEICDDKYTGAYAKANKLYSMMDAKTLQGCFSDLNFTQRIVNGLPKPDSLSEDDIHNYCTNGTFNNRGCALLNRRLHKFVESNRDATTVELQIFDDNTIKSCNYTKRGDARHYHPLNLIRIRLLAHLISCLDWVDTDAW